MYTLGNKPSTPNAAYEVLETVFPSEEFSGQEALDALMEVMELSESAAKNELNTLYRIGAIEDADTDAAG